MAHGKYEEKPHLGNTRYIGKYERKTTSRDAASISDYKKTPQSSNVRYVGKYEERKPQVANVESSRKSEKRPQTANAASSRQNPKRPQSTNAVSSRQNQRRPQSTNAVSSRQNPKRPQTTNVTSTKKYKNPPQQRRYPKRKIRRKNSIIYKFLTMDKNTKRKLYTLLSVSAISLSAFKPLQTSPAEIDQRTPLPESPKQEIIHTIGIPNEDAEIIVDGKSFEIDPNSFVIVSEDEALAYDVHGNFFKGHIDSADFEEVMQLTEEEMDKFNTIYQINSDIDVNVR